MGLARKIEPVMVSRCILLRRGPLGALLGYFGGVVGPPSAVLRSRVHLRSLPGSSSRLLGHSQPFCGVLVGMRWYHLAAVNSRDLP
eukprot:7450094-Pyramimonas_sp.AAC.1